MVPDLGQRHYSSHQRSEPGIACAVATWVVRPLAPPGASKESTQRPPDRIVQVNGNLQSSFFVTHSAPPPSIETSTVRLGAFEAEVVTNAGPRILGYRRAGESSPFAVLPDDGIDHPTGRYRFIGGHRLWRAPEDPDVTYEPDDVDVDVGETSDGFEVVGQPDGDGIVKHLTVTIRGEYTVVDHSLENRGKEQRLAAPWAITQLAPGGTAYLPTTANPVDADGVLPNRSLILWPYTELTAPEITFHESFMTIHASDREGKLKLGLANRQGWLAYHFDNSLFVKWAHAHRDEAYYVDLGASAQCYRDHRFLELETVGSRASLAKRERVTHREVWTIIDIGDRHVHDVIRGLPIEPDGLVV